MSEPFSATVYELLRRTLDKGVLYHEFLRVPDMSAGLYVLPVGTPDPQQPHEEDELYYIVAGKGRFTMAEQEIPVEAGTVIYVPKKVEHRFHSIEEDLLILVVFAPQETIK